jgi:hypothetical protein
MMANPVPHPILSGGTFVTLLIQSIRQRNAFRDGVYQEKDKMSNEDLLVGLIRVTEPKFKKPTGNTRSFSAIVSSYKSCSISKSNHLPFTIEANKQAFNFALKNDYNNLLSAMHQFTNHFFEQEDDADKNVKLVKALLELIETDITISDNQEFYLDDRVKPLYKYDLKRLTDINLPVFILGIWHFIVLNRPNNKAGKDTYESWHKKAGEKGGVREYIGNCGIIVKRNIHVTVNIDKIGGGTPIIDNEALIAINNKETLTVNKEDKCNYHSTTESESTISNVAQEWFKEKMQKMRDSIIKRSH